MVNCPVCNAEIEEDFGLVSCPACGASVLIGMDGPVQHTLNEEPEAGHSLKEDFSAALISELTGVVPDVSSEPDEPEVAGPAGELMPEMNAAATAPAAEASPDMREISQYGNSVVSQGSEGLFRFNIYISGVDTAEIRQDLKDAISDARFIWDIDGLLSGLNEGELKISDVTPIKAALVVNRIKNLPIKIRWEQYAIHKTE